MKTLLISLLLISTLFAFSGQVRAGGSEIGNNRVDEETLPVEGRSDPLPRAGELSDRKGLIGQALIAEISSTNLISGQTIEVRALVPMTDSPAASFKTCTGALMPAESYDVRIFFDRCVARSVYPRIMELTLQYRIPVVSQSRFYKIGELRWGANLSESMDVAASPYIQVHSLQEPGDFDIAEAQLAVAPNSTFARPGDNLELKLKLRSDTPLSSGLLHLTALYSNRRVRMDLQIGAGRDLNGWKAELASQGSTQTVRIQIPADAKGLLHIEIGEIRLLNEALQETRFVPSTGLGISVLPVN